MKRVLIQGATGSIGRSALSIAAEQRDRLKLVGFSSLRRESELLETARQWQPTSLALVHPSSESVFAQQAKSLGVADVFVGGDALEQQAGQCDYDILLNAVSGSSGIMPTIAALSRGKDVALANKETLVAAGEVVVNCARENGANLLPVDSEHSALFQCLIGEEMASVKRLWLTASGGPFWGRNPAELSTVTPRTALEHPTWVMGPKNSIDSATLFNKGLEVIEAVRLFDIPVEKIRVIRHRESVIHSLVEFCDGSFKAQLSHPDMRLPILYSLSYPERWESELVISDPVAFGALHFDEIQISDYPCLECAFRAIEMGGISPAVLSAADEVAVHAFLDRRIRFDQIAFVLNECLEKVTGGSGGDIESIIRADGSARRVAMSAISHLATGSSITTC